MRSSDLVILEEGKTRRVKDKERTAQDMEVAIPGKGKN
jgi:hypothetical protein